jgi:hypothetical protein
VEHDPLSRYPRPQLRRAAWECLDGRWDFAFDRDGVWTHPDQVRFDKTILVPFSPETEKSGIYDQAFTQAVWYRRKYEPPRLKEGERLVLHFGAVDHIATIWADGVMIGRHEGGFTPFTVDLTPHVRSGQAIELVVHAFDDPHDLARPRGKQDWQLHPHSIWYPRTTGIWQTVWVERLPRTWIDQIHWGSNLERWEIEFEAWLGGAYEEGMTVHLVLSFGSAVMVDDVYAVNHRELKRRIPLSDPGIDDSRNVHLWSPSHPALFDARLELRDKTGAVLDTVESYTALRSISVQGHLILLNARPLRLRMVLDQGYWPESGLTAPDDEAFIRDIQLTKQLGFNAVRKHQKIEDPRFLYWADKLGLLVWEEMPSAYRFTDQSVRRLTQEWLEVLARDMSHPCVIAWVPFNESWGVPNLPENAAERHYVIALYNLTKTLDPSRPVIGNDGWESVATDIVGIHDYDPDPAAIAARYHSEEILPTLYKRQRFGGRLMMLSGHEREHPIVLSEFGGLALANPDVSQWGYVVATDPEEYEAKLTALLQAVHATPLFAGFCYTQLTDTYQEVNGLLYGDRTPKLPIETLRAIMEGRRR